MDVRKEIIERTAQATHARGGWDIDICRQDAIMKQGLWQPQDSIEGITSWLVDELPEIPAHDKASENIPNGPPVICPEAA